MPLSDIAIKNAKPTEKPYKMPDEKGMYLVALKKHYINLIFKAFYNFKPARLNQKS